MLTWHHLKVWFSRFCSPKTSSSRSSPEYESPRWPINLECHGCIIGVWHTWATLIQNALNLGCDFACVLIEFATGFANVLSSFIEFRRDIWKMRSVHTWRARSQFWLYSFEMCVKVEISGKKFNQRQGFLFSWLTCGGGRLDAGGMCHTTAREECWLLSCDCFQMLTHSLITIKLTSMMSRIEQSLFLSLTFSLLFDTRACVEFQLWYWLIRVLRPAQISLRVWVYCSIEDR